MRLSYTIQGIYEMFSLYFFDSYTYEGSYNVEHIHSEATTIQKWLIRIQNYHGFEIGNPKILQEHFAMFVRRIFTSSCPNHFSVPC